MLNLYRQLNCHKIKNLPVAAPLAAVSLALLVVSSGCVQKAQDEAQLEITSVEPVERNGVYNVVGSTNLPESSRITISAVRYLRPIEGTDPALLVTDLNTNRSILDRQSVEVKQGKWQVDLNLWQIAPNGSFQEVWQANQGQMKLTPESDVTFIATYDPASQLKKKSDQENTDELKPEYQKLEGKWLRFTNEGEKYVQASQTLPIDLPAGKTVPPRPQPEDLNDGWGNRYQIRPEPIASGANIAPPTKTRQTNAPLSVSEFVR
ncbi:MAG: hypothetical protein ACHBN1_23240 [Heteroscytonema crispum UTEX LB 1556]